MTKDTDNPVTNQNVNYMKPKQNAGKRVRTQEEIP